MRIKRERVTVREREERKKERKTEKVQWMNGKKKNKNALYVECF
jgi:hypothetical protein